MKVVFFRTPKPKRFEYKPRHFDPEAEKRKQRKRALGLVVDDEESSFSSRLSLAWSDRYKKERKTKRKASSSAIIYIIIAVVLIYFIFFR